MRKNLVVMAVAVSLMIPAVSNAARDYGTYRAGDFFGEVYFGLQYGRLEVFSDDLNDGDEADSRNVGFMFGKAINDNIGWELNYSYTATKEDDWLDAGLNVTSDVLAFYVVTSTQGDLYFKGKLGYSRVTQDNSLLQETNIYGLSYGIGAGFKIAKGGAIEVEYTVLPTENYDVTVPGFGTVDFDIESNFLSVGYVWSFE